MQRSRPKPVPAPFALQAAPPVSSAPQGPKPIPMPIAPQASTPASSAPQGPKPIPVPIAPQAPTPSPQAPNPVSAPQAPTPSPQAPNPVPAPQAPTPSPQEPNPVSAPRAPKPAPQASNPVPGRPAPQVPKPVSAPVAPQTLGLRRALFIGINYIRTSYELYGCINDAANMQNQIRTFFPNVSETRLITDVTATKPTRANILSALNWLVTGLRAGEHVLFHYAGHGGRVRDTNGDEATGLDSCIYPLNNGRLETITDDELRTHLAMKIPAGSKCFVVLDCCHSGSAVDLRCTWQAPTATSLTYAEDKRYAKTAGTVVFLSGCHDTQTAADTVDKEGKPCGALTMALLQTWRTYGVAIKFKYILWDIRKFLRDSGYKQVPQLSTGAVYDINSVFDLSKA
jgi:hypothetical protein